MFMCVKKSSVAIATMGAFTALIGFGMLSRPAMGAAQPLRPSETTASSAQTVPQRLVPIPPKPGTAVEPETIRKLGLTSAWLANGVRFHHMKFDKPEDGVYASITLGGGEIEETAANRGMTKVATLGINSGDTSTVSGQEILAFLNTNGVAMRARADAGAFVIRIEAPSKNFEAALQAAHALLREGKISESALQRWQRTAMREFAVYGQRLHFRTTDALHAMLSGSDLRFAMPSESEVLKYNVEDAQAWYDHLRLEAPMEVAVVGDIELQDALPLVERYIGSLPARSRTAKEFEKLRRIDRPKGPFVRQVEVSTTSTEAMAVAGFLCGDARNPAEEIALTLAARILQKRLAKGSREERMFYSSVRILHEPDWTYYDSNRFTGIGRGSPENIKKLATAIHKMYTTFAKVGPTRQELADAKEAYVDYYVNRKYMNADKWQPILECHDLLNRNGLAELSAGQVYTKITVDTVQEAFKKYYVPDRQFTLTTVPKPPPEKETKSDAATKKKPG